MRLERSGSVGMGIHVWMKKNKRKKKGKETYGRKESKKNKKLQLNGTIIFSQYLTINIK